MAVLCCALGLLAERAGGRPLPGVGVPAVGLSVLIVVAGIATTWDTTAGLAVPLVVALAIGGIATTAPWRDPRLRAAWPWPAAVAVASFAIYALPSLGTGQGSIAGYIKLDDSATWLALTDHVFAHGRDLSGLAPSSVSRTLEVWLGSGYPVGAFMPVGVVSKVTGQDAANVYQPVIATTAAILALGLYGCVRALAGSRGRAAACAIVGVQASLFLGYAQWGGIKEVVTAALLPALALTAVGGDAVALALVAGALIGALNFNALVLVGPALLIAALALRRAAPLAVAGVVLAVAALPALATTDFVKQTTSGPISAGSELGNLVRPLSLLQGAG